MNRSLRRLLVAVTACIAVSASADDNSIYDVPRMPDVRVDGNADDWANAGFRVGVLLLENSEMLPFSDLNAGFRLGWNEEGLLVLITVRDDQATETPGVSNLYDGDSVELFVADRRGSAQIYQVVVSPGLTAEQPELRQRIADHRKDKSNPETLTIQAVRSRTRDGYDLEVHLPWVNLGVKPESGREVGFQLYVNDLDGSEPRYQVLWYPRGCAPRLLVTGLRREKSSSDAG